MANTYFQFKQFTINQADCAMKVCTDACLFGAWIADKLACKELSAKNILDIGAGTGLLSLMLAQKTNATIDAVELDNSAVVQAGENFMKSPWKHRLRVMEYNASTMQLHKGYELIISNPPFYENDLVSPDAKRNMALHGTELGFSELVQAIKLHLSVNGHFAVLLPYHRKTLFEAMAADNGCWLQEEVNVRQTGRHLYFRSMLLFSNRKSDAVVSEITIKESDVYTNRFRDLLSDYYLKL